MLIIGWRRKTVKIKYLIIVLILFFSFVSSSDYDKHILGKWYALSISNPEKDFVITKDKYKSEVVVHNGENDEIEISFNFKPNGEVLITQSASVINTSFEIIDSILIFPNRKYIIHSISKDTMKLLDVEFNSDVEPYYFVR